MTNNPGGIHDALIEDLNSALGLFQSGRTSAGTNVQQGATERVVAKIESFVEMGQLLFNYVSFKFSEDAAVVTEFFPSGKSNSMSKVLFNA